MNLPALLAQAHNENVRVAVALEGQHEWLRGAFLTLRACLSKWQQDSESGSGLVLSNDKHYALSNSLDNLIPPSKFKSCLGAEYALLVWDLCHDVNSDALAATSGTLIGGGVLLTLVQPEVVTLPSAKRWYSIFRECNNTLVLNVENFTAEIKALEQNLAKKHGLPQPAINTPFQLNQGQLQCVERIEHVANGHRNRPLVIRADRGRGKSTALGFAAAELINQSHAQSIVLVSNQGASTKVLREHFVRHLKDPETQSKLVVMPSDAVVNSVPECGLVLIDEAASIPLPVLERIIKSYSRVVMASTLHGYEGSGRGFDLKLQQILERCKKQPNFLTLNEPVRWAPNCALEQSINDAFVLNASFCAQDLSSESTDERAEWLRPEELTGKEQDIRALFSLLVLAHYQTRPSDLSLILDNPKLHIAVIRNDKGITGAALCIDEDVPEAADSNIADGIISGERRLKGRLLPQALAGFYADTNWLQQRMLRVMRIVVHPSLQNHGMGSRLLNQVQEYAKTKGFSGCSVSFGADARLLRFWQRAGYRCLRLSYKADASSGLMSAMLVKPLLQQASSLCEQHQGYFHQHLISGLPYFYKSLEPELITALFTDINAKGVADTLDDAALSKLQRFASSMSAPWDCWPELQSLVIHACSMTKQNKHPALEKLIRYVLKGDNSVVEEEGGKKAWNRYLREAIRELLANS